MKKETGKLTIKVYEDYSTFILMTIDMRLRWGRIEKIGKMYAIKFMMDSDKVYHTVTAFTMKDVKAFLKNYNY